LAWNPFRQREDQAEPQLGASAALAWPAERATWERIAYREPARIGTPRDVSPILLRRVEDAFPTLFDTYDPVEDDVVCVPSSPCPVLWGLRGEDPEDLARASATLGPERPVRETLFLTNQGTDDHLRPARIDEARPYASVLVRGRVVERPREGNGCVSFDVADEGDSTLRAMAYPPTRSFRDVARRLDAGDEVTIAGGVHAGPDGRLTVGLEKMCVHETAPRRAGNPRCPGCARTMKSAGRSAGFRCRACGTRSTEARTSEAGLALGWHEVPASARRHLARPLKRGAPGQR
jgi:tRNA(Ile2)-agmatinylcytidine synthase